MLDIFNLVLPFFGLIFLAMFSIAFVRTRKIDESTIRGLTMGNIGYMGPVLPLLAFGAPAAVPVALIFCFGTMSCRTDGLVSVRSSSPGPLASSSYFLALLKFRA